jgi:orotidine-5'-phosphate decarboxylase
MKMKNFATRLFGAIDEKRNPSIIGLDSELARIPATLRDSCKGKHADGFESAASCMLEFNKMIIDSVHDIVPALKIQSAFYEQYGPSGCRAFIETAKYAKSKGLLVIGDVKRGDIGNTTKAYSNAYIGQVPLIDSVGPGYDLDGITVNPYLGTDGIRPFVDDCVKFGKGIFVLVKTSNPSSSELQDLGSGGRRVFEAVAGIVNRFGEASVGERGFSPVGAVVGATHAGQAAVLRKLMPRSVFLVPGFGAQGGSASDVVPCFNDDGYGALVHSARAVIFAGEKKGEGPGDAARQAAIVMKDEIAKSLKEARKYPW